MSCVRGLLLAVLCFGWIVGCVLLIAFPFLSTKMDKTCISFSKVFFFWVSVWHFLCRAGIGWGWGVGKGLLFLYTFDRVVDGGICSFIWFFALLFV